MKATITIKLAAESLGEAKDSFAANAVAFKDAVTKAAEEQGLFGLAPGQVQVRFLMTVGQFAYK